MRGRWYRIAFLVGIVAALGWACGGGGGGGASSPGEDTNVADAPVQGDDVEEDAEVPLPTECDPDDTNPCDGAGTCAIVAVLCVDLRGDVNRNGTVDLDDPTEDLDEGTWDADHGAIFLANIDDDEEACPVSGSDEALAACNDAKDQIVNGHDDLDDMARMGTVPWPAAPDDAIGTLSVSIPAVPYVRVFRKIGDDWVFHSTSTPIGVEDIRAGVEFAIEGTDFVRDDTVWDGIADLIWTVEGTGFPQQLDIVRYRLSPILLHYQTQPAVTLYATKTSGAGSVAFRDDLKAAMGAVGMHEPLYEIEGIWDQWTQDFFETGWMAMPAVGGQHVIHVNFRSANYTTWDNGFRPAGKVVYTHFRGKDVAGATVYDPDHNDYYDSLNSFGNTETVPPYEYRDESYPNGRVFRGSVPNFHPDRAFDRMLASQKMQPMLTIDTSWLLVAHVDETIGFLAADNLTRGWTVGVNNAAQAWTKFQELEQEGYGDTPMFVGKQWSDGASAEITISEVLADPDLAAANQHAVVEVEGQLETIQAATGVQDEDLVQIPFLHYEDSGYSVAYQPGFINGIHIDRSNYAPPKGHGVVIDGGYLFEEWVTENLAAIGLTTHYLENWDLYHVLLGEVHCGSNATREIPAQTWWGSGL